jgi:hypothetical protein
MTLGSLVLVVIFILVGFWEISKNTDHNLPVQQVAVPNTDMNGLLQTSIANIQHQGKLEVMSLDIQSINTSKIEGMIVHSEVTTLSKAKVQYIMNLADFKSEWVSLQDKIILVTLPKNFLKAEIIPTSTINTDHSGWFSSEKDKQKITSHNTDVNHARMIAQVNAMTDIARPAAAEDLQHLFEIPLEAVAPDVSVRVSFQ